MYSISSIYIAIINRQSDARYATAFFLNVVVDITTGNSFTSVQLIVLGCSKRQCVFFLVDFVKDLSLVDVNVISVLSCLLFTLKTNK